MILRIFTNIVLGALCALGLATSVARAGARASRHAASQCIQCPAAGMLPGAVTTFLQFDCLEPGSRLAEHFACDRLKSDVDQIARVCHRDDLSSDELLWQHFKTDWFSPCSPIPSQFINPRNPHFAELMKMLAPKIVFDPNDPTPPRSLNHIVDMVSVGNTLAHQSDTYEGRVHRYPYSHLENLALANYDDRPPAFNCNGTYDEGRCCGTTDSPLYFDVGGTADAPSVTFTTAHLHGSVMETSDLVTDATLGAKNLGSHVFDSEAVQYRFAPSGVPGSVMLGDLTFSRHGLATETLHACDPRSGLPDSNFRVEDKHIVLFQAHGGHSFYPSATYTHGTFTAMNTDSNNERRVEERPSHPVTEAELSGEIAGGAFTLNDRTVANLVEHYNTRGGCTSNLSTDNVVGIGSLWNDPRVGANRRGAFGTHAAEGDVCVQYGDSSRDYRSIRWLTSWLDLSVQGFQRFGCGSVAGRPDLDRR